MEPNVEQLKRDYAEEARKLKAIQHDCACNDEALSDVEAEICLLKARRSTLQAEHLRIAAKSQRTWRTLDSLAESIKAEDKDWEPRI